MVEVESRSDVFANVLYRTFDFGARGMSRSLAEDILAMDFAERDAERAAELNEKANEGLLTKTEVAELEAYINVGNLLALWQSRARQALQKAT
jgi:hypothetical protein